MKKKDALLGIMKSVICISLFAVTVWLAFKFFYILAIIVYLGLGLLISGFLMDNPPKVIKKHPIPFIVLMTILWLPLFVILIIWVLFDTLTGKNKFSK